MSANLKKSSLKLWIGTIVALLLGVVVAMIFMPAEVTFGGGNKWGWVSGTFWYWGAFGFMYSQAYLAALIGMTFFYIGLCLAIFAVVLGILRKNKFLFVDAVLFILVGFFLSYNLHTAILGANVGLLGGKSGVGAVLSVTFCLFALIINIFDLKLSVSTVEEKEEAKPAIVESGLDEDQVREIVRQELADQDEQPKEQKVRPHDGLTKEEKEEVEQIIADKTLDEEEVRDIVRDELSNYEVVGEEEEEKKDPHPSPNPNPNPNLNPSRNLNPNPNLLRKNLL